MTSVFLDKLGITQEQTTEIMAQPNRSRRDFRNENWLIESATKCSRWLSSSA